MDNIIIYEKEYEETKQQVISYAMLYFGIYKYKLNSGSMEFDLYQLACKIGQLWEHNGLVEEILISGDICSEKIEDKVLEYIKENK